MSNLMKLLREFINATLAYERIRHNKNFTKRKRGKGKTKRKTLSRSRFLSDERRDTPKRGGAVV